MNKAINAHSNSCNVLDQARAAINLACPRAYPLLAAPLDSAALLANSTLRDRSSDLWPLKA